MGIATHIGRGCEAFNPARHIVVPWLLMIFGQMVWVWVWVILVGKVNILENLNLVDGGSADGLVSMGFFHIFFPYVPGC